MYRPLTAEDPKYVKNLTNFFVLQSCRRFKNLSFVKPVINKICNKSVSGTKNRPCTNKQVHISGYISPLELLYNSYPLHLRTLPLVQLYILPEHSQHNVPLEHPHIP